MKMERDEIIEIGIDDKERLYLKPASKAFPYIYREAAEVHWDSKENFLYSPKPREWSYLDWYKHIIKIVSGLSCELFITDNTHWVNIPVNLKAQIIQINKLGDT